MEDTPPDSDPIPPAQTTPPRSRRRWGRGILWAVLLLLLVLLVFHRPLFFWGARKAAIYYAGKSHLALDLRVSGDLYHNLVIDKVTAKATGPSPIQKLTADSIEVRYSVPDLIRKGKTEFLKSVAVNTVDLELDPTKAPPKPKSTPPPKPAQFNFPAFIPKELQVRGVNLLVHEPGNNLALSDLLLTLYPDRNGELGIGKLQFPNGRVLTNIAATTRYQERNLFLSDLSFGPEVRVSQLNLDFSKIDRGKAGIELKANLFKGEVDLSAEVIRNHQLSVDAKLAAGGISLDQAGHYFGIQGIGGTLVSARLRFGGDLNEPASWTGALSTELGEVKLGQSVIDEVTAKLDWGNGQLRLVAADLKRGQNHFELHGSATLPKQLELPNEANGYYSIKAPDLAELGPLSQAPLPGNEAPLLSGTIPATAPAVGMVGSLAGGGNFSLAEGRFSTAAKVNGTALGVGQISSQALTASLQVSRPFPIQTGEPITKGLAAQVSAQLSDLALGEYRADSATAELTAKGNQVELKRVAVNRAENQLVLTGNYLLPDDLNRIAEGKGALSVQLSAPALEAFSPRLGGNFTLQGQLAGENKILTGDLSLSGSGMRLDQFVVQSVSGQVAIARNKASTKKLWVDFGSGDFANISGEVGLSENFPYLGQLEVKLRDLARFKPLLNAAGRNEEIAGALNLNWSGKGGRNSHAGDLNLSVRGAKFGALQSIEAAVTGTYSGQSIAFPVVRVSSNKGSLGCSVYYGTPAPSQPTGVSAASSGTSPAILSIQNLGVRLANQEILRGHAFIPLDLGQWNNPAGLIPANGDVYIDLDSPSLDLKQLAGALGQATSPVTGNISLTLRTQGSVDDLKAALQVQGRDLKATAAAKLAPAKLDLGLNLEHNRLTLKSSVIQEDIKPLLVEGTLPFDLRKVMEQRKLDEDAPLKLSARLDRTPLAFLAKATPQIRYAEGEASLLATVVGSIRQPVFGGAARIDMPALRFSQATLPGVANFRTLLSFEKNQLTVQRLGGEVGGGPFTVTGKVGFEKLTEPVVDLRIQSKNLLVQRNNSMTVRANTDLLARGPLNAATVSGVVGVTNSRFFREVEILPIGLPGRPARRVPKTAGPQLVLPPALQNWNFNIRVRTDDPFKVRSNLAKGGANVDLVFAGTGAQPGLDGVVTIQNFVATLPFSKMNVDYGYLTFSSATGLNPQLDIHGTSELREYKIDIYIQGTAQDPQTVMTSDPPLPQEDIVALLATGATVKEIGGNPDVLAGRAAVLLFDKVYRSIFKKNAPTADEPLSDRIKVDLGGVSSTTGKQEVSAQFKVTDQVYIIGEIGLEGSVGGRIKYVLRFR